MKPHNWWAVALIGSLFNIAWAVLAPLKYDLQSTEPKHVVVRYRVISTAAFIALWWTPYWGPHALNFIDWACK